MVSTPTTEKGQKRKSKADPRKDKGKKKKGESTSTSVPSLEQNVLYFDKDESQEMYNVDFSLQKVSNGRWIDYNFFDSHNFEFSMKLNNLDWKSITMRDDVYPDLVAHFYANAIREYNSVAIDSYIKGVSNTLDKSVVRKILGIGVGDEIYRENITRKEQLKAFYGQDMDECVQPIANDLPLKLRLVHHFVCTMFIPKTEKYKHVMDKELFFLLAYITDSKIDLPLFILDQMFRATINKVNLPYGIFLTKVFKYFKIDLNNKKKQVPKAISDWYNEKTLKKVGYVLKNNKWTPKQSKKIGKESVSKEKAPSESKSAKKSSVHKFEGSEGELSGFMVQVLELSQKLNKKVDNAAIRLLLLEKKVRELKKEVHLLKLGKGSIEEEEKDKKMKMKTQKRMRRRRMKKELKRKGTRKKVTISNTMKKTHLPLNLMPLLYFEQLVTNML